MRTCVVCPTRDRPESFLRTAESHATTSKNSHLFAYVDEDQRRLYEALSLPERTHLVIGPRIGMVTAVNVMVQQNRSFDAFGYVTDDARFTAPGWDDYLAECIGGFRNGIGVVSAHHQHGIWLNFPFVSRQWIDVVGWLAYPPQQHYCWDTLLELLGEATAIVYAPQDRFAIDHDAITSGATVAHLGSDAASFLQWCITSRRELVMKLRAAM